MTFRRAWTFVLLAAAALSCGQDEATSKDAAASDGPGPVDMPPLDTAPVDAARADAAVPDAGPPDAADAPAALDGPATAGADAPIQAGGGVGAPCDVGTDAGGSAVFNPQAIECRSRVCLRPARDVTIAGPVNTGPLCSATCNTDQDCVGELRSDGGVGDRRCQRGFVCGVAFEVGPLCCLKLCVCTDFLTVPPGGFQTPTSCQPNATVGCPNL